MANPNAVVARVLEVSRGAEADRHVALDGDHRALIDSKDPHAEGLERLLNGIREQNLPVYLEIDPDSSVITRLLIPHVTRVTAVRPAGNDVEVALEFSHAVHVLSREQPDFAEFEDTISAALRDGSTVAVSEDDAHQIVDVRPFLGEVVVAPPRHHHH